MSLQFVRDVSGLSESDHVRLWSSESRPWFVMFRDLLCLGVKITCHLWLLWKTRSGKVFRQELLCNGLVYGSFLWKPVNLRGINQGVPSIYPQTIAMKQVRRLYPHIPINYIPIISPIGLVCYWVTGNEFFVPGACVEVGFISASYTQAPGTLRATRILEILQVFLSYPDEYGCRCIYCNYIYACTCIHTYIYIYIYYYVYIHTVHIYIEVCVCDFSRHISYTFWIPPVNSRNAKPSWWPFEIFCAPWWKRGAASLLLSPISNYPGIWHLKSMYVHIYNIHTCKYTYIYTHIHIYIYIYICVYVYIYIYVCMGILGLFLYVVKIYKVGDLTQVSRSVNIYIYIYIWYWPMIARNQYFMLELRSWACPIVNLVKPAIFGFAPIPDHLCLFYFSMFFGVLIPQRLIHLKRSNFQPETHAEVIWLQWDGPPLAGRF